MKIKKNILTLFFITLCFCINISCMQTQEIKVVPLDLEVLNTMQTFLYKLVKQKDNAIDNYIKHKNSDDEKTKGNAFWDITAPVKTPVSVKLAINEQSTISILKKIPNSQTIIQKLKNPTPGGILEQTIIEFIYFCSKRKDQKRNAVFFLEQFPELRKSILYYNTYKDQNFSKYIEELKKESFFCRLSTARRRTATAVPLRLPLRIIKKKQNPLKNTLITQKSREDIISSPILRARKRTKQKDHNAILQNFKRKKRLLPAARYLCYGATTCTISAVLSIATITLALQSI